MPSSPELLKLLADLEAETEAIKAKSTMERDEVGRSWCCRVCGWRRNFYDRPSTTGAWFPNCKMGCQRDEPKVQVRTVMDSPVDFEEKCFFCIPRHTKATHNVREVAPTVPSIPLCLECLNKFAKQLEEVNRKSGTLESSEDVGCC